MPWSVGSGCPSAKKRLLAKSGDRPQRHDDQASRVRATAQCEERAAYTSNSLIKQQLIQIVHKWRHMSIKRSIRNEWIEGNLSDVNAFRLAVPPESGRIGCFLYVQPWLPLLSITLAAAVTFGVASIMMSSRAR